MMDFKSILNKLFSAGKAALKDKLADEARGYASDRMQSSSNSAYTQNAPSFHNEYDCEGVEPEELRRRIRASLDSLEGVTYLADVRASDFDVSAHPKAKPIDFLVSKNGIQTLAIVVVDCSTYRNMSFKSTKELIESKNIQYMRFFVEMPNKPEYITERIKNAL